MAKSQIRTRGEEAQPGQNIRDDNKLLRTPELEKVADSLTPKQTADLNQAAKEIGIREGNISQADFEKKFPRP